MGKLWKSEEDKLIKSGRKWAECDEYLPYRYAELFCEKYNLTNEENFALLILQSHLQDLIDVEDKQ